MSKIGPTIILLLICAFMIAASADAQPVYFLEEVYRSLAQLEDALATGEISQEDYEQLLDAMLQGCPHGCSLDELLNGEAQTAEPSGSKAPRKLRYRFRSSFTQKLSGSTNSTRYDRVEVSSSSVEVRVSMEHHSDGEILLRSRTLQYRAGGVKLTGGSLDFKCGMGLTVGPSSHHSRLRSRDDFGQSLRYPVSNRLNGLMLSGNVTVADFAAFGSELQGEDYRMRSYGAMIEVGGMNLRTGAIVITQRLTSNEGRAQTMDYIGPNLNLRAGHLDINVESSLGIDASSAHVCSAKWRGASGELGLTLFAYGRDYQNLMSGGYAYSDYQSDTIAETGFIYSDKRRGRSGISATSRIKLSQRSRLDIDLVRWRNGIADRECAAFRLALVRADFLVKTGRLRLACLREDFDMTRSGDKRTGISATTTIPVSRSVTLRSLARVENRLSIASSRVPLRCGVEGELQAGAGYSVVSEVEYYDSDTQRGRNGYLNLSVGQRVYHADSPVVATSLRVRYYPGNGALLDWEARISVQITR